MPDGGKLSRRDDDLDESTSSRKEAAMFETIIWATDGSETADSALPFARALAESEGGRLIAVHGKEVFIGGRATGIPVLADEEEVEVKIDRQVEELREAGLDATFKLISGMPSHAAQMLAEVARDVDADVIVVGTRGHGPLAGAVVGSVTQRLLHIAPCPVVAVPPAKQFAKRSRRPEHAATA
jgi:nucleotide-binding universal stress UspA family protein